MLKSFQQERQDRNRRKLEAKRKLPFLIAFGNEQDIVDFTKRWNPSISAKELQQVTKLFRDAQRDREPAR